MPPVIREATAADLPALVRLLNQLSLDEALEDETEAASRIYVSAFEQVATDPRQRLLVLDADGSVQGTACLIVVPNLTHQGRPYAIIENVVVDAEVRSNGYGHLLMEHAIELAKADGCYKVSLTSNRRRDAAHRFYERLGFRFSHHGYRIDF